MADAVLSRGGIYAIRCHSSGKSYIGSAVRFATRFKNHRASLRSGKHHSPKLQGAWDKYGEDAFSFEVLEIIRDKALLLDTEQRWIDRMNSVDAGYNVCRDARSPMLGRRFSAEHREKIAAAMKGRKASAEARENMRRAALARTPEIEARIAASRPKIVHTEASRARISAALTGIKRSDETRARVGKASRGRTHSEETKAKRLASWKLAMAAKKAAV